MQYIKDDIIATVNSGSVIIDNMRVFNPTEEMLINAGYTPYTPKEPEPLPEPDQIEIPKRYSQLKIIRELGDQWPEFRIQLEDAGVLDQFFAASYLQEDDPVFSAFIVNVPDELKEKLNNCQL